MHWAPAGLRFFLLPIDKDYLSDTTNQVKAMFPGRESHGWNNLKINKKKHPTNPPLFFHQCNLLGPIDKKRVGINYPFPRVYILHQDKPWFSIIINLMKHAQWVEYFFSYQLLYHFSSAIRGTNKQWNVTKQKQKNKKRKTNFVFFRTTCFIKALTVAGSGTGKWQLQINIICSRNTLKFKQLLSQFSDENSSSPEAGFPCSKRRPHAPGN